MKFGCYNAQINTGALEFREGDVLFKARVFVDLISKVRDYRLENGGDLSSGWQHRLGTDYCKQNPDCRSCTNYPADIKKTVSIGDMKLFFHVINKWLTSGEGFCDNAVAESRAKICSTCPYNVQIDGCGACFRIADKVSKTLGKRSTSYDSAIYGCMACGCNLKVKVWCPPNVVAGTLQKDKLPSHCWQLETSQNGI